MGYKILVLDLDGTLTNSKKEITQPTLEALLDIQKKGVKVVLASGRPTIGVLPLAKQLHMDEYGSYVLSFNGARITDCRTGAIVSNRLLPKHVIRPAFELAKKYAPYGVDLITYDESISISSDSNSLGKDRIISGFRPNKYTQLEADINHIPIDMVTDLPSYVTWDINKLLGTGEPEYIDRLRRDAIDCFGSDLGIYCSDPFFLELVSPGVDKASSMDILLKKLGLTRAEMICIGDGYNDISMIEAAGLGVAMANAQPAVLEAADYVTKSNNEDGVVAVIDKFIR